MPQHDGHSHATSGRILRVALLANGVLLALRGVDHATLALECHPCDSDHEHG